MTDAQRKPEDVRSPGDNRPAGHPRPHRHGKGWDFGFRKGGDLNHRGALLLFGLLILSGLLASLYLGLVSYTTLKARYVQDLREMLLQTQAINATLEKRIGEKQQNLFQQAIGKGFIPASQVETVGP